MELTKYPPLTPQNAPNALKIINTIHPEWGIHTFQYQGKPVSNKKDKYVHTYGPSYDIQVLYERNFKQWAVVSFATQEHLTRFKQFMASKKTSTLEQYLKHIDVECETGQFEQVEAIYTYEYCDKTFVIYQIKEGKSWEYFPSQATSRRFAFIIRNAEAIEHHNLEMLEWLTFRCIIVREEN
jgi:hypothetical protein